MGVCSSIEKPAPTAAEKARHLKEIGFVVPSVWGGATAPSPWGGDLLDFCSGGAM